MKQRIILASLLMRYGRQVPVETLLRRLWETELPHNGRGALQTYVTRLRRVLQADLPFTHSPGGYRVTVGADDLDLAQFDRFVESARVAQVNGDADTALRDLRHATALWRGPILSDIESPALRQEDAQPLQERFLLVADKRFELELAAGYHREFIDELRTLAMAYPFQESIRAHLMVALHRSGRRLDALEVYRETSTLLRTEFGVEPGATLNHLHLSILRDEGTETRSEQYDVRQVVQLPAQADTAEEPVEVARYGPFPVLCQLPPAPGDFVGRTNDIADLTTRLEAGGDSGVVPIVVIAGAAGVGKSALALHVAHLLRPQFPDGQLYLNLQGADKQQRDTAELLGELLHALGWIPSSLPHGVAARTAALRARLADRRVLIVLDDAADSRQVGPLLPGTPGAAVLVTSRSTLSELSGSWSHRLPRLPHVHAVELLQRIVNDGRVSDDSATADEVVKLCGYLPLAIRIVGARLQTLPTTPLRNMADRLRNQRRRLDELAIGDLQVRAELDLAYRGLPPAVARAMRRMGMLHAGHFAAWMLGELCDDDGERLVEQLAAAGLLEPAGNDPTGQPRYRPHDLVALYARELARGDEDHAAFRRYVDTLISLAAAGYPRATRVNEGLPPAERLSRVPAPPEYLAPLVADIDVWVHAESAALLHAAQVACDLGWYAKAALLADLVIPTLAVRGDFERLQQARARIRDAALDAGDEITAYRSETSRADLLLSLRVTEASAAFEACVPAFRRHGLTRELVHSLTGLAFARFWEELPTADASREAITIAQSSGEPEVLILALRTNAETLIVDRAAGALPLLQRALVIAQTLPYREPERVILVRMTDCALQLGDLEAAEANHSQALVHTDSRNTLGLAWLLLHHSRIQAARREFALAIAEGSRARQLMADAGDIRGVASASLFLAEHYVAAGDPAAAAVCIDRARFALGANGVPRLENWARRLSRLIKERPFGAAPAYASRQTS
ncbi:BTAD domain-containing putative transcriptional regulator [Micromonospora sp. NPDC000663]|uniref:AfsR/SARP family transcriptional regulator n=1 Tax=Micromonospora sp. NPDC000663 TaxID=3364218 RepID=UPI0036AA502D